MGLASLLLSSRVFELSLTDGLVRLQNGNRSRRP